MTTSDDLIGAAKRRFEAAGVVVVEQVVLDERHNQVRGQILTTAPVEVWGRTARDEVWRLRFEQHADGRWGCSMRADRVMRPPERHEQPEQMPVDVNDMHAASTANIVLTSEPSPAAEEVVITVATGWVEPESAIDASQSPATEPVVDADELPAAE